ncbi:MAG TPA: hypothetical protein DIW47_04640 [Bacteroidetes bacterium]|nr:hypothetical protein [Bacteroidota bacterium]
MRTNLVGATGNFMDETYAEFLVRYFGFGSGFYSELNRKYPEIFEHLEFYTVQSSPESSFALYDKGEKSFAIQLDPFCEDICIWYFSEQREFGHWHEDPGKEALAYLKVHFL